MTTDIPGRPFRSQEGFTLVELLIVVAVIGVIAAIAVPSLLSARRVANESSAMGSMRSIASAQTAYASACGQGSYATGLPVLAVPVGGAGAPFLPDDLTGGATVAKSGFTLALDDAGSAAGGLDCNGTQTSRGFYASAAPVSAANGSRAFAVNQSGAIYYLDGATPPNPPQSGLPLH